MSSHLAFQASLARVEDLRREARRPRAARSRRPHKSRQRTTTVPPAEAIAIRRATPDDDVALLRIATLDGAQPLHGDVLIADVEDEPHAAVEIATGATIADPFEPTAHLVDLLGVRGRAAGRWPTGPLRAGRAVALGAPDGVATRSAGPCGTMGACCSLS